VLESDVIWDQFKEKVTSEFPDVTFPDEYIDDGVVTCTINSPDHSHVTKIIEYGKGAMKTSIDGGRLLLEFDTAKYNDATSKKDVQKEKPTFVVFNLVMNPKLWVFFLWLIALGFTLRFIHHNQENYRKLL
jgi:hypothetical protein